MTGGRFLRRAASARRSAETAVIGRTGVGMPAMSSIALASVTAGVGTPGVGAGGAGAACACGAGGLDRRRRGRTLAEGRQHRELGLEVRGGREARGGVLRERAVRDRDELRRDVRLLAEILRRRLGDVLHRDDERRLAVVGHVPREALVRHDADRVDVAARVGGPPESLFRRHVMRRPDHHAVERELLGRLARARGRSRGSRRRPSPRP